ncbi:MAG: hypothetical protein D8M18_11105, partial [Bacteroidetes bacterium]|nr:hypothetical protein [Bacteroidota bacterium]
FKNVDRDKRVIFFKLKGKGQENSLPLDFSNFTIPSSSFIATNVLALGAVADFGAQNCQHTTKVDAR